MAPLLRDEGLQPAYFAVVPRPNRLRRGNPADKMPNFWKRHPAANQAAAVPLRAAGFPLVRYFSVASLAAFLLVAAASLYFERRADDFFEQVQREQNVFL